MKNIVLTGFMASGKTVTGKRISEITGFDFFDMDEAIENKTGMEINKIFKIYGEKYFRDLESRRAEELSRKSNSVISCGGGVVLRKQNIEVLRKNGVIINLEPSEEVIKERLSAAAESRPLLSAGDIEGALKRFSDRRPYYDNCDFKVRIELGRSVNDIAREIADIYNNAAGVNF